MILKLLEVDLELVDLALKLVDESVDMIQTEGGTSSSPYLIQVYKQYRQDLHLLMQILSILLVNLN